MIKFPKIMSKHKKMSAFMISFSIHLAILVLAFSFVAFTVIEKKKIEFLKLLQNRGHR